MSENNDIQNKILSYMRDEAYKPLTIQELESAMQIADANEFREFVKTLVQMEDEGYVLRTRSNRYGLPEKMSLLRGKVIGHSRGFAFVVVEDGGEDIFIPPTELNGALHQDTVFAKVTGTSSGSRREGTIVRIIERGVKELVGTYHDNGAYGFVVPDEGRIISDVFIPKNATNGAVEGHKVIVSLTKYPEGRMNAEGEVINILGHKNDPGVDILSIIYKYGLPGPFPEEAIAQANAVPDTIEEKDYEGRRDLRNETIVTIDGADAKDLDDAVIVKKLPNGNYKLGVHIADVSHYVTEGSPIDEEALERGTSVYLVDRVIPMIPHRLSNGICSLNPKVPRLTLSCEMEMNSKGEVVSHEIFQSVIQTTERMTYSDVNKILEDKDEALIERYKEIVPMFEDMEELAAILRKKRMERGAVDFDFKEAQVKVDEEGKPSDIVIRERSVAEKLIEEFMLAANETVAEHFHWMNVPFIYRVHEDPKEDKLQRFFEFITNFGYVVKGKANDIHPRALQQILETVKGTPEEMVINTVMLRSMKQARYDAESLGHFGLSTDYYSHFTSPIRRYPDLIVHRLIRTYLIEGKTDPTTQALWKEKLDFIAEQSSNRERRSTDAERETDDLKKAEYMEQHIGEEFEGIISSVTNFGLFVELPNTIEGLVHVSFLTDDYYRYDESQYAMIGERTANIFRIGDEIKVRVSNVNLDERSIDFEIVGMQGKRRERGKDRPVVIESGRGGRNGRNKSNDKDRRNGGRNSTRGRNESRNRQDSKGTTNESTNTSENRSKKKKNSDRVTPAAKKVGKGKKKPFYQGVPKKKKKQ